MPYGRIWPNSVLWRRMTKALLAIIADDGDERLPVDARASLIVLAAQLQVLQTLVGSFEKRIIAQHRASEASKRLASIPGIGVLGASAITATDTNAFRSGRDFAAWVGLVPRQDSTGGKQKPLQSSFLLAPSEMLSERSQRFDKCQNEQK